MSRRLGHGPVAALAALLAAALVTWPAVLHPTWICGHPLGESDNHYWMLWRSWKKLSYDGPLVNLPEGLPVPLMDPINLPLSLPGMWLDPALGYGLVLLGNLLLAFAGAWCLARVLRLGPGAALTAGLASLGAPFLSGAISFGLTESWPVGWFGLHAAALLAWARHRRPWQLVAAALSLAAIGLSGWYHALFGLVVEAPLLIWARRRGASWGGLLAQGAAAALLVLPRLVSFLAVRSFWDGRWRAPTAAPPPFREGWRELPVAGTDLLNFVLPSLAAVPVSKSVYLGLVLLALALAAGRRAAPLWALAAPLWVLALGHWLSVAGHTELLGHSWSLPAIWLTRAVPALEGLSHWHRAAGPAAVFLAVAGGMGAERLARGQQRLAALLALPVLIDSLAFSQTPWPRDVYDPSPPAAYRVLAGPGALVQLPFDNGRREFDPEAVPRIYNRWQPELNRPVSENYEGPDAMLARSRLIAAADGLCGVPFTRPRSWRPPERLRDPAALEHPAVVAQSLDQLRGWGVRWVALHRDRGPTTERAAALLERVLGAPIHDEGGIAIYAIPPE